MEIPLHDISCTKHANIMHLIPNESPRVFKREGMFSLKNKEDKVHGLNLLLASYSTSSKEKEKKVHTLQIPTKST